MTIGGHLATHVGNRHKELWQQLGVVGVEIHVVAHVAAPLPCPLCKVILGHHQRPYLVLVQPLFKQHPLWQGGQPQVLATRTVVEQFVGHRGFAKA